MLASGCRVGIDRTRPFEGSSFGSVVNSPLVSRWTPSRTPTVRPSRVFCEVVRLSKMKPSLNQDDLNIELVILWICTHYKADIWCLPPGTPPLTLYYSQI